MIAARLIASCVALAACLQAAPVAPSGNRYHEIWAASPMLMDPGYAPDVLPRAPFYQNGIAFQDTTIRQTVRVSQAADTIRIRLSHALGTAGFQVGPLSFAIPTQVGGSAIDSSTVQAITFSGGSPTVWIGENGEVVSDPITIPNGGLKAGQHITLDLYSTGHSGPITGHYLSLSTSYFAPGNQVGKTDLASASTQALARWFYIAGVEAWHDSSYSTLSVIGDSLADGWNTGDNLNNRWHDFLVDRMQGLAPYNNSPIAPKVAVASAAISANKLVLSQIGMSVTGRLSRDVLSRAGLKYIIMSIGVNDFANLDPSEYWQTLAYNVIIQNWRQIITRAHGMGVSVIIGTITPFSGANIFVGSREQTRQALNTWIRTSGVPDGFVDFDVAVRDPVTKIKIADNLNSGDFLHPNALGYKAMADAVDLSLLTKLSAGADGYMRK